MQSPATIFSEQTKSPVSPPPAKPLSVYLALFAAGILAPILLIMTYLLFNAATRERDDALRDAEATAVQINTLIDVEVQKAIAAARALAFTESLASGDFARFDAHGRMVATELGSMIVARDSSGRQLTNSALPSGSVLATDDGNELELDRRVTEKKSPTVSDLRTNTLLGKAVITVDVPVFRGSEIVAFVSVRLLPDRLADILITAVPAGWIATLLDRGGRVVARSHEPDHFIGTAMTPQFFASSMGRKGIWQGFSLEGIPVTRTWAHSSLTGWRVVVAVPDSALSAPGRRAFGWLFSLVSVSLMVSLVWGRWFSSRIAQPIENLASNATQLGQASIIPQSGVREVQVVATALRDASDGLRQRAVEAENRVEQIRQNEERLQLVQDTAGIGTIDYNLRSGISVCSPRFYTLFSLPEGSSVTFATFIRQVHPGDRARIIQELSRLFAQGGPFETEYRLRPRDGIERWIYAKGRLEMTDGAPQRLLAAYIDITARKQNEQALLESEARFRGTFENAAVGVAHVAFDGRLLLVNRRIRDILRHSKNTLLSGSIEDITHNDDIGIDHDEKRRLLANELATYGVEKRMLRLDRTVVWCALTLSLQRDHDGKPLFFITTMRDITASRQTQKDLEERLREIEALYDYTPIGLALVDRDRRFVRVNRSLAQMNDLPSAEHLGREMWEIVPHLREALDPAIEQILLTGQGSKIELTGGSRRQPKIVRFWHAKLYPLVDNDGIVTAVGIAVEDVTDEKSGEEHLRFLLRELSHRTKNLLAIIQGMANQTARSVETVEEFHRKFGKRLMGMAASHDLLVNRNWIGVSVEELVWGQLGEFVERNDPRISIEGLEVDLTSGVAEGLGLALHELATNSLKFGALRSPTGRLEIGWKIVADDEAGAEDPWRFQMHWVEHTAFQIEPPKQHGFGRIVIERLAEASLKGKVTLEFPPHGIRWSIDAPATGRVRWLS